MKTIKKGKYGKEKNKLFKKKTNPEGSYDSIITKLQSSYSQIDPANIKNFSDFPLSPKTLKGLKENEYNIPTKIQSESIGFALQGEDILGAAKTGSGKTLAFLIPVLEVLFVNKWTHLDGLGALIITPVRELAYQIFETLRKIGCYHDFSAGLIIGGKDLHFEKNRMHQVNIIICTPGRLLQHMDENPLFDCSNLQILVLDEADRCLDMGFEKDMNNIIENLPLKRQTLLFSATQTKSVKDLARLSLKDPKYISVHENAKHSTPDGLTQSFLVCELHDKLALLWSFVKNHRKQKVLVFLSSCKQVKYMNEIFCKLRAPTAILALHGGLHQLKRMEVYRSFTNKQNVVLFATDIAARGLDFPEVNWVLQLDCPEDAVTYIHRAGRTARYQMGGESLLVLLPSEKEAMLKRLEERKIPINEIKVNPSMFTNPQVKIEAFLARDPNLKASAQRAFVSYFKSVFLMKDKEVFKINSLDSDSYARSFGLIVSPRIRFLQRRLKSELKGKTESVDVTNFIKPKKINDKTGAENNVSNNTIDTENHKFFKDEGNSDSAETLENNQENEYNRPVVLKPKNKPIEMYNFGAGDSDSEDEFFKVKRKDHDLEGCNDIDDEKESILQKMIHKSKKPITKMALAKKMFKKNIVPNKKIVFTEEGQAEENRLRARTTEEGRKYEESNQGGIDIAEARAVMKAEDKVDRKLYREKVKAKHKTRKLKEKKFDKKEEDEAVVYSGSDSEGEPDLSWLPDPDKIYGPQQSDTEEDNFEEIPRIPEKSSAKRKNKQQISKMKKKIKINNDSEDEPQDTGLSLLEDEELALQFLSNKR